MENFTNKSFEKIFRTSETFSHPRMTTVLQTENKKVFPNAETFLSSHATTVLQAVEKNFTEGETFLRMPLTT